MAGKPYNLRRKVEIPVELQVQDDGAFLNEFSSLPTPGQSKADTDIESDIDSDIDIDALVNGSSSDSDHGSVALKHRLDVMKSERAPHRVKKSVCKPIVASSNLTVSQGEADLQEKLPNLQTMRHDRIIQEQVENRLKELCGLNKKVLTQKLNLRGVGRLMCM